MVAALDAALVRAGHRSLVIGVEGSAVSGSLIPLPRVAGAVNQRARGIVAKRVAATIASTLERHPVDLVHLHLEDFPVCLPATGLPTLVTLHRPLDDYPRTP
ncbi:hypothetical protein DEW08_12680 [Azospirillum thermophilum]|uniref:Glycosyltransferase subfamily 4-like N-terminal domain-containing protein n=2 Tax=Azospirillum thermophilum TaxID=2202148 RepID=A0A2S2CR83_9PROT|nr:hypothetical protein DEW08_12680 [Azospirillum thermophilum]